MNTSVLEICVDSLESLLAAHRGGANRVELCAALTEGGLTPSIGFIQTARKLCPELDIHVMIRPRMGDFLYSQEEKSLMLADIEAIRLLGVQGIVVGALSSRGELDEDFLRSVKALVQDKLSITFHRAIDVCNNLERAIETLTQLGINRVLTSGGKASALDGADELARLTARFGQQIIIMPGAGIRPDNILQIREVTGAHEFHLSAKYRVNSLMEYRNDAVSMGGGNTDEYSRFVTSEELVRKAVLALNTSC